ncbi:MAG: DUF547 domain-containing protein [Candidatus Omnitrophica bacterium]|nr:DUF547 domain-containing protein [Candidatus Omnitrophota bacterium]
MRGALVKALMIISFFLPMTGGFAAEHALFTELLAEYVEDGSVDYNGMCDDQRLERYLHQIEQTDIQAFDSDNQAHAFWINAYNALTLHGICAKYPIKSMNDFHRGGLLLAAALGNTFWDRTKITLRGSSYSLKQIEHDVIHPSFQDPRSHLALACGAVSCPSLRNHAFEAETLNEQLEDQAGRFLSRSNISFDDKTIQVSPLLKWNAAYFGDSREDILKFVLYHIGRDSLLISSEDIGRWRLNYAEYDLTLNRVPVSQSKSGGNNE